MNYKIIFISFILLFFILGTASANDSNSTDALGGDVKEIYVNATGNDLNTGSIDSPYATIGKAISEVNASDDATIHIGKGTFSGENDGDFSIDLNHKVYGGNLKFIGSGANETILDGQSQFRFAQIGDYSNITFKNITFINFKSNEGGTLNGGGIVTIENCVFNNSYASGVKGGAICIGSEESYSDENTIHSLYVKNSQFIDCSVNSLENKYDYRGGGAIFAILYNNLYLENNTFVNSRITKSGSGVAIHASKTGNTTIKNNKFINLAGYADASIYMNNEGFNTNSPLISDNTFINCSNPSDDSSIMQLFLGGYILKNNTFINSSNGLGSVFANFADIFYLKFNISVDEIQFGDDELNNGVNIPINVTDDNGNLVQCSRFYINLVNEKNTYQYSIYPDGNIINLKSEMIPNGLYNLTIQYNYVNPITTDVLAQVNVNISDDSVDLYVSPNGDDSNKGTYNSPFATIEHAIDVGFDNSLKVVIHLLNGTYSGEGNVNISCFNKGNLRIVGEKYNETIIDGENINWFLNVGDNVFISDLKFINGKSNTHLISGGNLHHCILENNSVIGSNYILRNVVFDELVYIYNSGTIGYVNHPNNDLINISNSYFAYNDICGEYGVLFLDSWNRGGVSIENCKFIKNNAEIQGAAISVGCGLESKNNYFCGNIAPESAAIKVYDGSSKYYNFENDTFVNNIATEGNYGVIGVYNDGYHESLVMLNFNNCDFINNSAKKGGAMGIKQGSISNSVFINNTALYGGAICIMPIEIARNLGEIDFKPYVEDIDFNNLTFENNKAEINGHDLYLDFKNLNEYWLYRTDLLQATLNFNDLNTEFLSDVLKVDVIGPCGAIVGGGNINLKLNDNFIGIGEIINSQVLFNYSGFDDGEYKFSGNSTHLSNSSIINEGKIVVNLGPIGNHIEYWISPEGSDDIGDGSINNPFKSIAHTIRQSVKNNREIVIHLHEGVYGHDLNTQLELSACYNITLIGAGRDKTIIDGENCTYFAKLTAGKNKIVFSNLTICNMMPDNRKSRVLDDLAPITICEGSNLYLENVKICNSHGGLAIIENKGNLFVNNSQFLKNAFSKYGIICGGNVSINNTVIHDNFAEKCLIKSDFILLNNSEIKNTFNGPNGNDYDLIVGKTVIENTKIINDGDNSSLRLIGIDEIDDTILPAFSIKTVITMNNVSMINNFRGTPNPSTNIYYYSESITLSPFGVVGGGIDLYGGINVGWEMSVTNSSFINFINLGYNYVGDAKITFDGCYFENLTDIFEINKPKYTYLIFKNSMFVNVNQSLNRPAYYKLGDLDLDFNNNYWSSNSKPVISYIEYQDNVLYYEPESWIILTKVNGIYKFQGTDGENVFDYSGNLPVKIFYGLNEDGEIVSLLNFNDKSFELELDDDGQLDIHNLKNIENVVPIELVGKTVFSSDILINYGEKAQFVSNFTDLFGSPLVNCNISFIVDNEVINATTDLNGCARFDINLNAGGYSVISKNPVTGESIYNFITINKLDSSLKSSSVTTVFNGGKYLVATLCDLEGKALANQVIFIRLNGNSVKKITDENGQVKLLISLTPKTYVAEIIFNGNQNYKKESTNAKIVVTKATPKLTAKKATLKAKTKTKKYTITLKDNQNKAMKKVKVTLKVKGKTYKAKTNKKGKATFKITKLTKKGKYTAKVKFSGNKNFKAVTKTVKLTVKK